MAIKAFLSNSLYKMNNSENCPVDNVHSINFFESLKFIVITYLVPHFQKENSQIIHIDQLLK